MVNSKKGSMTSKVTTPIVRFTNVRLVRNGKLVDQELWIQGGKILNPEPVFFEKRVLADISIDCRQLILAPGYLELQINGRFSQESSHFVSSSLAFFLGGFGYDFSQPEIDVDKAVTVVATNLVKHGVTSFCPTLVTSPAKNYQVLVPKYKRGPVAGGATVLGLHLEGPFISPQKKGAHPEECIQKGALGSVERIKSVYGNDLSAVSIITVAPELDESNVIRALAGSDSLIVSLGHSTANLSESERAFNNGARMITHLFNAMPMFHHRDPGLLGLLTVDSDRQIYYGIIADGIHTHYSALRLAYHANRRGMVLVSDAISACGLESGLHKIGMMQVEIKENRAYVAGTDTLCGAIALLDHCVKYLWQKVGCPVVDAIDCATLHPAQALGIESLKGTLNFGTDADFIILNETLDVQATFVDGKLVFAAEKCPIDLTALQTGTMNGQLANLRL